MKSYKFFKFDGVSMFSSLFLKKKIFRIVLYKDLIRSNIRKNSIKIYLNRLIRI